MYKKTIWYSARTVRIRCKQMEKNHRRAHMQMEIAVEQLEKQKIHHLRDVD